MTIISHTLGFPRIGLHRELKYALEQYWHETINQKKLIEIGHTLRIRHWKQQKDAGINLIPVGDFAWYDHILTTSLMLNNIPDRHNPNQEDITLNTLFKVSRGYSLNKKLIPPSEMKKWFNTNYHYIVPEFTKNQKFKLNWTQLFDEIDEALSLQYKIKPILIGPITYLWLGKTKEEQFNRLSLLPALLPVYQEILNILAKKNIHWVQIDEPILVLELPSSWKQAYIHAYTQLHSKVKLLLTTYFDDIYHQLNTITQLKVDGLHVDLVSNSNNIPLLHKQLPKHWILSAGVINGRNIWKTNLYDWFKKLSPLIEKRKLWIGPSCSLLHCPIDLQCETKLNKNIKTHFAFALQKCFEIKTLCDALNAKNSKVTLHKNILKTYYTSDNLKSSSNNTNNPHIQERIKNINNISHSRNTPYETRIILQNKKLNLPLFPTTTIGSFPQTEEIRKTRANFKNKKISKNNYYNSIKNYIHKIIMEQEKLDLDILVHGEPERNDMVEYFGENLNGFTFTQNGWVQSYGSRCVKPPIIIGDINHTKPITTKWIHYAQSLTKKPVKGILTGPITIMSWSFLREDIKRETIAFQLALSIHDEILDLEKSGIKIIQIDEPALREGLPLKRSKQNQYLSWAIQAFRIATSSVKDDTQIHTHICYSEFNDIINAIIALDVDVISIEASRSDENSFKKIQYFIEKMNGIGPGIYDIHSPTIPTQNHLTYKINQLLKYIPKKRLWINPDCGLKTRSWPEIRQTLKNMVSAVKILREQSSHIP